MIEGLLRRGPPRTSAGARIEQPGGSAGLERKEAGHKSAHFRRSKKALLLAVIDCGAVPGSRFKGSREHPTDSRGIRAGPAVNASFVEYPDLPPFAGLAAAAPSTRSGIAISRIHVF
jgi:hypothetical protein